MIAYAFICYVLMLVWGAYTLFDGGDAKVIFKVWLLSPVTLPIGLVLKFINW